MSVDQNRDRAAVRFPPPLLYVISAGLGWLLQDLAPLPDFEDLPRKLIGNGVMMAGFVFMMTAFGHLIKTGQDPEPWKPTPSILSRGVYRFSRNPMYVAMAMIQLGFGARLGNLWIMVLTVFSQIAVYLVAVRHEEAYLERKFGDEYRRYKARVRRWL